MKQAEKIEMLWTDRMKIMKMKQILANIIFSHKNEGDHRKHNKMHMQTHQASNLVDA